MGLQGEDNMGFMSSKRFISYETLLTLKHMHCRPGFITVQDKIVQSFAKNSLHTGRKHV